MNKQIILIKHHKPSVDWITGKWNINPGSITFELQGSDKPLKVSEDVKIKLISETVLSPYIYGEYDVRDHTIMYKVFLDSQYEIKETEWEIKISLLSLQLV